MTPLQKVSTGAGLAIPAVAVVWYVAVEVNALDDAEDRLEKLEARVTTIERSQATDEEINKLVRENKSHLDWLRFHHHDEIGGRGHVDGN